MDGNEDDYYDLQGSRANNSLKVTVTDLEFLIMNCSVVLVREPGL